MRVTLEGARYVARTTGEPLIEASADSAEEVEERIRLAIRVANIKRMRTPVDGD